MGCFHHMKNRFGLKADIFLKDCFFVIDLFTSATSYVSFCKYPDVCGNPGYPDV